MDKKQLILVVAVVLAVVLIGFAIKGLTALNDDSNENFRNPDEQTTAPVDASDNDNIQGADVAEGTNSAEGTKTTEKEDIKFEIDDNGNLILPAVKPDSNNGGNTNSGSAGNGNSSESSESTENAGNTEGTEATQPSASREDKTEIDFSEFFK